MPSLRYGIPEAQYVPHQPFTHRGREDGQHWVPASPHDFTSTSHTGARVAVAGHVLQDSPQVPLSGESQGGTLILRSMNPSQKSDATEVLC